MDEMESRLRSALQRRPAPPGFASRVLSLVESQAGRRTAGPLRRFRPAFWAIAAALALAAGIGLREHERSVGQRRQAALGETLTALSLAAAHLERAQEKALSSASWQHAAERLARLPAPSAGAPPGATHSKAGTPRI